MPDQTPFLKEAADYHRDYDGFDLLPAVRAAVEALPEYQAMLAQSRTDGFRRLFPVLQRRTPELITNIFVAICPDGKVGFGE